MSEGIKDVDLVAVKERLERVVLSLETVEAVLVLAGEALGQQASSYDPEIALVLMRCASDPLHNELKELRNLIDSLGGTELDCSSDADDEPS
jgi:hypothetical protein